MGNDDRYVLNLLSRCLRGSAKTPKSGILLNLSNQRLDPEIYSNRHSKSFVNHLDRDCYERSRPNASTNLTHYSQGARELIIYVLP